MTENFIEKLFEHNNWANLQIIKACSALTDAQLDAEPQSATKGSIRGTLEHLVRSQHNYVRLLTLPVEERLNPLTVPVTGLEESVIRSGEALLALVRDPSGITKGQLQTTDGYFVEPWVVILRLLTTQLNTESKSRVCSAHWVSRRRTLMAGALEFSQKR